jgi:hypothetical protein
LGGLGRFSFLSAEDAKTDACCVYVAADVEHAIRKYGFRAEDVTAVGNPDLVHFGLPAEAIASHLEPDIDRPDVMYIDTGLVYTGYVFSTQEEFKQHLIDTNIELAKHGKRLIFKPHPDHRRSNMLQTLTEAGIEICANEEFAERLTRCCAAIVEPSSLGVIPALLGMPLFLAQYGKLEGQRFGQVLASYPRAKPLSDLTQFADSLTSLRQHCDVDATRHWIAENAGPLPADRMPSRVADVVAALIARGTRSPANAPGSSNVAAPARVQR